MYCACVSHTVKDFDSAKGLGYCRSCKLPVRDQDFINRERAEKERKQQELERVAKGIKERSYD